MTDRVAIRRLLTGVPGLDQILGGGLPEFSFNLIAGPPGAGKTTLAQQIMFGLAGPQRPALYFSVVGEPPLKMLRYQQQFTFFDMARVNESVRYVNLGEEVVEGTLDKLLARIIREVESTSPGLVIVDSFRSVTKAAVRAQNGELDLQQFVQQLAVRLTGWEATTFLVGEYQISEAEGNPVFTIADGLLWLAQSLDRNSMVRKMQIMKMRGQAPIPGLHTFRITDDGIQVFPRVIVGSDAPPVPTSSNSRLHARSEHHAQQSLLFHQNESRVTLRVRQSRRLCERSHGQEVCAVRARVAGHSKDRRPRSPIARLQQLHHVH